MGVSREDRMFVIQLQSPDKGLTKFAEEMQRSAQKRHMSANGFAAGQTADGLVYHCLKDGSGKVFFGGSFVDQGLDIRLGKYAAAGSDGVQRLAAFGVFIQSGSVGLQKRGHLIDKRARASCADAVHPLFYVAALKIDDLGVFPAQLDGHIRLRGPGRERLCHSHDLLYKGDLQMLCQSQSAGTGDDRIDQYRSKFFHRAGEQESQSLLDLCIMPLIIGEKDLIFLIQCGDLNGSGTDVDSKSVAFVHISGRIAALTSHFSLVFSCPADFKRRSSYYMERS